MTATDHPNPPGRIWAIGVLVLAAGVSMSMNTVHAWTGTTLPKPLALMYGIAPVALAAMQSHAVALRALRQEQVGLVRKVLTFGLVACGLGLSFLGIYDLLERAVPNPLEGAPVHLPAVLFPITVDLMALAALHELLRLTPSLVSAVQPAPASAPNDPPAQDPAGTLDDLPEVHDEPPADDAPFGSRFPVLGPMIPIPRPALASIAANGSAPRTLMVTAAVPETPTGDVHEEHDQDRPTARRRSTDKERQAAREMYLRSVEYGSPMTQEELAKRFGYSRSWAKDRMAEVDAQGGDE